MSLSAAVCPKF